MPINDQDYRTQMLANSTDMLASTKEQQKSLKEMENQLKSHVANVENMMKLQSVGATALYLEGLIPKFSGKRNDQVTVESFVAAVDRYKIETKTETEKVAKLALSNIVPQSPAANVIAVARFEQVNKLLTKWDIDSTQGESGGLRALLQTEYGIERSQDARLKALQENAKKL